MSLHRLFPQSILLAVLGACGLLLGASARPAGAQGLGPLRLGAGIFSVAGTGERLPFWLRANQRGKIDPASANGGLQLSAHRPFAETSGLNYAFGATLLGRASQNGTATLHELYGRLQYGGIRLTAGRREQTVGRIDTSLSLGSVTRSRNAPPPPKISLSTDGYLPIPGTARALALKGYLAHGWLEEDRFVQNALLHEKYLYFRIRLPDVPVAARAGFVHYAQWGGTHPQRGPQASSIGEWADVAFGLDVVAEDRSEAQTQRSNANHLGMYDFSLEVDLGGWRGLAYRQFYHEDIASLWFRNVWDGLWGVGLRRNDPSALVSAVLWEHLRTTRQSARRDLNESRGSDSYYNHGHYQSGWTYQGRTLGIPLLTPAATTPGVDNAALGIANNIVVAHHVGIEGHLGAGLSYQLLGTYSRNYGARSRCARCNFERTDRRDQWSFRIRVSGPLAKQNNLRFRAAVALDTGEFYEDRVGVRLGLRWRGLYASSRH